jgi:hypothetical protein
MGKQQSDRKEKGGAVTVIDAPGDSYFAFFFFFFSFFARSCFLGRSLAVFVAFHFFLPRCDLETLHND